MFATNVTFQYTRCNPWRCLGRTDYCPRCRMAQGNWRSAEGNAQRDWGIPSRATTPARRNFLPETLDLDAGLGRNLCWPDTRTERKTVPARQVHVVLAIAALTLSLATATNASLHNTKEVKALQQVLRQCGFDPGPSDGNWGTKTARSQPTTFGRTADSPPPEMNIR